MVIDTRYISVCWPCEVSWSEKDDACFCCGREGDRVTTAAGIDTLLSLVVSHRRLRHQRWLERVENTAA